MKLSRRSILRGACGAAIALPALESAGAAEPARRFITFFTPNGHAPGSFTAVGNGTSFALTNALAPLEPHRADILLLKGLGMPGAQAGHAGIGSVLTGMGPGKGISLDQALAKQIGKRTRWPSLELGVAVPKQPADHVHLSFRAPANPVPAVSDPAAVFARLFGGDLPAASLAELHARRKSVLDGVRSSYERMHDLVSAGDRMRIKAHLEAVRALEGRALDASMTSSCRRPSAPEITQPTAPEKLPLVTDLQMDLMVAAMSCDLTAIATFMLAEAGAPRHFPFLGLPSGNGTNSWLGVSHRTDAGALQAQATISEWCAGRLAYLITKLKATPYGPFSLWEGTTILWASECNRDHTQADMPFLLAGSAGGQFRTGRVVSHPIGTPHARLLLTLAGAMGWSPPTFGDPKFGTERLDL